MSHQFIAHSPPSRRTQLLTRHLGCKLSLLASIINQIWFGRSVDWEKCGLGEVWFESSRLGFIHFSIGRHLVCKGSL